MSIKIAVNLPVKSLDRSVDFFTQLGFSPNPQLTDNTTAHLVVSDQISAMLVTEELFRTLTGREVTDTTSSSEMVVQLQLDSRESVDRFVNTAIRAGGQIANPPNDQGSLYGRSFTDIDGHLWDAFCVDPSGAQPPVRSES